MPLDRDEHQDRKLDPGVRRGDELMSLCDQLKSRIGKARDLNQQLASTLVESAVA